MILFNSKKYEAHLLAYIKREVIKASAQGVVIGVSGGVDSSVVLKLAKKAFPNSYSAFFLPIESCASDYKCVDDLVNQNLLIEEIDLKNIFDSFMLSIKKENTILTRIQQGNLKARIRNSFLFTTANIKNYLVLGTSNFSEYYLGYFTKFGDGSADIYPLIRLFKSQVYDMANHLTVPSSVVERAPSAGLWQSQTDEKEMGFSYAEFENFFKDKARVSDKKSYLMEKMNVLSEHKRQVIFPEWPNKV